ncbi:hypothetical protein [Streptomyces sp. NPDC089795]|uniref:hypothetical protein n=1 Tax=Streptomyces sp. NPDC089795 TaxID=3155297 RepID=UPI0034155C72
MVLVRLLDPDPVVREAAAKDALREVTHQNTVYEATVPVALYVAAVLDHPAVVAGGWSTVVGLLDWLGSTAYDADDACVAIAGGEYEGMRAFRQVRPAIFSAVRPHLGHADADVRDAALIAALPLAEHPVLAVHRGELADHARRSLATSADRRHRDRVLDALRSWGHDISGLENAADIAARELRARRRAERASWADDRTGGYSADPPF